MGRKIFFVKANNGAASCMICDESVAVLKEYNLCRHYETKHLLKYLKFIGKLQTEKFQSMKRSLQCQRNFFTQQFTENKFVTRTSYKIVQKINGRGKPFTDGSYIKEFIMETAKDLCPQKPNLCANISLSASAVVRRTKELRENIVMQLRQRAGNFLWDSLELDESTYLASTSQLLMFIYGVNLDFQVTKELISVSSTHGTTIGKDTFFEVQKTLQSYNLHWNQLQCETVNGEKNKVERIMTMLQELQLPKALFLHCIQQALCGKHFNISCALKPVVTVANLIRGHALNQRQF